MHRQFSDGVGISAYYDKVKSVTVVMHQVAYKLGKAMYLDQGDETGCSLIIMVIQVKIEMSSDQQDTWIWGKILQVRGRIIEKGKCGALVLV